MGGDHVREVLALYEDPNGIYDISFYPFMNLWPVDWGSTFDKDKRYHMSQRKAQKYVPSIDKKVWKFILSDIQQNIGGDNHSGSSGLGMTEQRPEKETYIPLMYIITTKKAPEKKK